MIFAAIQPCTNLMVISYPYKLFSCFLSKINNYPKIDMKATGENILNLRKSKGLSVKDLQRYLGFEGPQAIYKWQWGECLPSVDNLFALSKILNISMNEILIEENQDFFIMQLYSKKMNNYRIFVII